MSGEGLVLHLGVDGTAAKQEVGRLVKDLQAQLGAVKIDFSGKMVGGGAGGGSKGVRASVRNAAKEAAAEIKVQQRILTQVIESGVRESQRAMKRLQDRATVEAARANRGGGFDPLAPFMNPMLSGRGLSGRTRFKLQEYKASLRSEQREREQIVRQQIADQKKEARDQQVAQRQIERQQIADRNRYIQSSSSLASQRAREEAKANRAREADRDRERERQVRSRNSLNRQRVREEARNQRQLEAASDQLNSMVLNPDAANYSAEGLEARKRYVRDSVQGPRFARQQAAQRSEQKAFAARGGRGPDQKAIAGMFGKAGVYRAEDMRRQNRRGHRGNMMGMGAYQFQQMFEDYQYAGIRGMGNNLAFMGASVGGGAGMGIIGAALALQIGELTYKMLGYAEAEEKAREAGEKLAESQLALIDIQVESSAAFASMQEKTRLSYEERFENPQKKSAREKFAAAEEKVMQSGNTSAVDAIAADVMKDPDKYIGAGFAANISDFHGMSDTIRQKHKKKLEAEYAIGLTDNVLKAEQETSRLNMMAGQFPGMDLSDAFAEAERKTTRSRRELDGSLKSMFPQFSGLTKSGHPLSGNSNTDLLLSGLSKVRDESGTSESDAKAEIEAARSSLRTVAGSTAVARKVFEARVDGNKQAFDLTEPLVASSIGKERSVQLDSDLATSEERRTNEKRRQADLSEKIHDAEQDTDRIMKSQLSTAEDMVDSYKRKVATFNDAKTASGDSFGARMFGINRERTAGFLEQAGASPAYIQQRDDMIVQSRLQFLRGAANSAGKSGDLDRQIEMLKELQNLQMDMAGNDTRFNVANGFFNAAGGTQKEIEAAYQAQVNSATSQQQAWQGVVNSLQAADKIKIDPMSPDALPKLQQYLAMLQSAQATMVGLNPAVSGMFGSGLGQAQQSYQTAADFQQANYDLFGAPHARGGLIGGEGRNDTVNARLMPNEYVIRADVVKRLGAATFEGINRTGMLPRMAGGGFFSGPHLGVRSWMNLAGQRMVSYLAMMKREQNRQASSKGLASLMFSSSIDPRVASEKAAVDQMQMDRAARSQAMYDLFGPDGGTTRTISINGIAGAGIGGSGSGGTSVGQSRPPRIGSFGGYGSPSYRSPNIIYGDVLSAIAPGFSGGLRNIGGFSSRLLGGNYSGGDSTNSWWGSLSSKRFGGTGLFGGVRDAAGGIQEQTQQWRGSHRRGGFHRFASGGFVQPFASGSYQPAIQAIVQGITGGGSGLSSASSSTVNNNRANIGAININVTGSGAAGLAIDQARRAQHAAKLRKG